MPIVLAQPIAVRQVYPPPIYYTTQPASTPKIGPPPTPTPPPPPAPIPPPHTPQLLPPVWPAITDLVKGRDGRYQQSDQIPEIQACLKAAVRRANANLGFYDAFPDTHRKGEWLANALVKELGARRNGTIEAVDDRARHDDQYFNRLLSMVSFFIGVGGNVIKTN